MANERQKARSYETASGRYWDPQAGMSLQLNNNLGYKGSPKYDMNFDNGAYANWIIPTNDFGNLGSKGDTQRFKIEDALDFAVDYIKKGGKTTDKKYINGLKQYIGNGNQEQKIAYIDYILDQNADKTGFDSSGQKYVPIKDKDDNIIGYDTSKQITEETSEEDGSGLSKYRDFVTQSLMTNPNGAMAQQYRDSMYGSIAQYENTANATLASAEMDAYRALGQSQLQLENQIAAERMNAIKSGVTSAQLASREIASMFATQTGAAQVASQMAQNRADMANQFGQQRAAVEGDLWNILNGNQQTAANTYAQLGTAQASYNSYINSYAAQLQAMDTMRNRIGQSNWENLITSWAGTKEQS